MRIPKPGYMHLKALAGETGMSVNEYMNYLIWEAGGRRQLGIGAFSKTDKEDKFWSIHKIMNSVDYRPMGANEDDKVIYGVDG